MTENTKRPIYLAIATQKGGVGKSALNVVTASMLYYKLGYNVLVVDCDYSQSSIYKMRNRDLQMIAKVPKYNDMWQKQLSMLNKPAYTILHTPIMEALDNVNNYINDHESDLLDFVIFDLPGTIDTEGVISTIVEMDYIIAPMIADDMVVESSVSFAMGLQQVIKEFNLTPKGFFVFWNKYVKSSKKMSAIREKYSPLIENDLGLQTMKSHLSDLSRMSSELQEDGGLFFRSTLFAPSPLFLSGSNLDKFVDEILELINRPQNG